MVEEFKERKISELATSSETSQDTQLSVAQSQKSAFGLSVNRISRRTDYNMHDQKYKEREMIFASDDMEIRRPTYMESLLPYHEEDDQVAPE